MKVSIHPITKVVGILETCFMKISELPLYCQAMITPEQRIKIDEEVKDIKETMHHMLNYIGQVKFINKNDKMTFEQVKARINIDFIELVSNFILCRTELLSLNDKSINFLLNLFDMHLKHIDNILYEYNTSSDPYHMNMLKKLCSVYTEEMKLTIYACKNLFKKSDFEEYSDDFSGMENVDEGSVSELMDL